MNAFLSRIFSTKAPQVCVKECIGCSHERLPSSLKISTDSMIDSVKPYTAHTFIVTPTEPFAWPAKIEEWSPLKQIADSKISVCARYPYDASVDALANVTAVDIITYPASTLAQNAQIDRLLDLPSIPHDKISVFICTHTAKDKRCGLAGPLILAEFHTVLTKRGLLNEIDVYGCSHLGGHKFAGTLVIYPMGVWYGRVEACHVDQIITDTLLGGQIIDDLHRGSMNW